jgi:serine/threonine protein kinase
MNLLSDDNLMRDVTQGVQDMSMPDATESSRPSLHPPPTQRSLVTPDPQQRRPLDQIAANGPPAKPIPFEKPRFERGRRYDVLVYDEKANKHSLARNVLFRDFSREFGDADGDLGRVKQAYWPLPYKEKINTIMGHVEICVVLTRCIRDQSDDDVSNSDSDDENSEGDEDIVFQITNRYVAVKVNYCDRMDRLRDRHAEDPLKEIAAMQVVGNAHPNVMGIIEVLFDGANLNVVMPYCGSGDLFELLQESQSTGRGFTEGVARYWFRQIIKGVQFLHSKGICHRDLSPENIMIDNDNSLIIDLGMAIRVPYTDPNHPGQVTDITRGTARRLIMAQGACGKLPYMSPEVYKSRHPFDGGAVDVWTAGTILFCMLTGNRSYQRPHDTDPQYYWMTHGLTRLISDWGIQLSREAIHLMENVLQPEPRLRFTVEEVIRHPWMALPDALPPSQRPGDSVGNPLYREEF